MLGVQKKEHALCWALPQQCTAQQPLLCSGPLQSPTVAWRLAFGVWQVSLDALRRNDPEFTDLLGFFRRYFTGDDGSPTFEEARANFVKSLAP